MDSPSFRGGGGRGRGFDRGGFRGGRGRGQNFGDSPAIRTRDRSPVQQIRRNRLDDDSASKSGSTRGPGGSPGPRPRGGRPPFSFRGGGNFSPRPPTSFRPEICQDGPMHMNMNVRPQHQPFSSPGPERIYRNNADAPPNIQQQQNNNPNNSPPFGFQNQNNMRMNRPLIDDSQDEPTNFANAGSGPESNPWLKKGSDSGSNQNPNSSGMSLLKPQYLNEALRPATPSQPISNGPTFGFRGNQQQTNFAPAGSTNPFDNSQSRFPASLPNPFQHPPPNLMSGLSLNQNQFSSGPGLSGNNNFVPQNQNQFGQMPYQQQQQQQQQQLPSFLNSPPPPVSVGNNYNSTTNNYPAATPGSVSVPISLLSLNPQDIMPLKVAGSSKNNPSKDLLSSEGVVSAAAPSLNPEGGFFVKAPMRYDGQDGAGKYNPPPHPLLSRLSNKEEISSLFSKQYDAIQKTVPEQNRVKPQPPPPPKIGISTPNPNIPAPPSPPSVKVKPSLERNPTPPNPSADDDSLVSYELQFLDLTSKYDLTTSISPRVKAGGDGKKLYSFSVEFGRDNIMTLAEGQYFPTLDKARENAYCVACQKVLGAYGPSSNPRREDSQAEFMPSQSSVTDSDERERAEKSNETEIIAHGKRPASRRVFRSQQSWPNNSSNPEKEEEKVARASVPSRPSPPSPPPAKKPLLSQPPANTNNKRSLLPATQPHPQPPSNSRDSGSGGRVPNMFSSGSDGNGRQKPPNHNAEERFKDYMDTLHMQCWLKPMNKMDRDRKIVSFEIEVQSYDQRYHKSFFGEYFSQESSAKESAFSAACDGLERFFARELGQVKNKDMSPNQRAFMDLRSVLGLTVRCLPETQQDVNGQTTYAFNIEFSRGEEWETVYGEFSTNEKQSMEKAYELATWRVKYIYGPELEINFNDLSNSIQPPKNQHQSFMPRTESRRSDDGPEVDWQPPSKRGFNPSQASHRDANPPPPPPPLMGSPVGKSRAYIPPTVKSQPQSQGYSHSYNVSQTQLRTPMYEDPPPTPAQTSRSRTPVEDIRGGSTSSHIHEDLFKEYSSVLNLEYMLRKIPKFEGPHKIYAYEVKFKGKTGNGAIQQSMGEYFRDEGIAKENAFKYACELLSSKCGSAFENLQEMNRFF